MVQLYTQHTESGLLRKLEALDVYIARASSPDSDTYCADGWAKEWGNKNRRILNRELKLLGKGAIHVKQ